MSKKKKKKGTWGGPRPGSGPKTKKDPLDRVQPVQVTAWFTGNQLDALGGVVVVRDILRASIDQKAANLKQSIQV